MRGKFIAYFEVLDAFKKSGCPICSCVRAGTVRQLRAYFGESVNDPDLREKLRASYGFCNWHAGLIREVEDPAFGLSIIYGDLIETMIENVETLYGKLNDRASFFDRIRKRKPLRGFAGAYLNKPPCMFCVSAKRIESNSLEIVLERIDDPQFARAYAESDGLCVPHFMLSMKLNAGETAFGRLFELTLSHWKTLSQNLKRFKDKHDYRNEEAFTAGEEEARRKILDLMAGASGVFPGDLHRLEVSAGASIAGFNEEHREDALPADAERLEFEKKKLEVELKDTVDRLNEYSSLSASLRYRLWEATEAKKTLEMNLTGERVESEMRGKFIDQLKEENASLKDELKRLKGTP